MFLAVGNRAWNKVHGDECQGKHQRRRRLLYPRQGHQGENGQKTGG